MRLAVESVIDAYPELNELVLDYFAKTEAPEGVPPLDMDWDFYISLERKGLLLLFTVREKAELVGFAMYVMSPHPHHKGLISAMCDIIATRLGKRNKGIGTTLIEAAEAYFRQAEVDMVVHGFRTCYNVSPLFERLGYKMIEQQYMKRL